MKKIIFTIIVSVFLVMILTPLNVTAEMLDKYAEPAPIAYSGSFEASLSTRMDFELTGGTLTGANWSLAYLSASYLPTGTIKVGENVSLLVRGTQPPGVDDILVFNSLTMSLIFRDSANKDIGEPLKYSSGNIKESPMSHQLSGTVPEGTRRVILTGVFNSRWAGMVVVAEGVSVNVELMVEPEPTTTLPVATEAPVTEPVSTIAPEEPTPVIDESDDGQQSPDDELTPKSYSPWVSPWVNPWEHAGVLPTILIALISAIMAVLGGAIGSAAGASLGAAAGTAAGTVTTVGADGSVKTVSSDGTETTEYPDGSKTVRERQAFAAGSPGHEDPSQPMYVTTQTDSFGTETTEYPDGSKTVRERQAFAAGSPGHEDPSQPMYVTTHTDSFGTETTEYPDGSKTVRERQAFAAGLPGHEDPSQPAYEVTHFESDGTITKEFPDGHKEITHPDGTITTEEPEAFRA